MKTFDQKIEQTLQENSEWSGSADALWGKISSQLQPETTKRPWKRKPFLFGAAATVVLAFMLHTMFTPVPLPPSTLEPTEMLRMQTFGIAMLPEPEVYHPGEQVELAFGAHPPSEWAENQELRLAIWKEVKEEQILAGERMVHEEEILGQSFLSVQSPVEPGLYRLVLEGTFMHEGQTTAVFAEKTILVEGEKSDENIEND